MKIKDFKPRVYQGKNNILVKLEKGISKCWRWDAKIQEYRFRYYEARKRGLIKKEDKQCFQDLKDAKNWLYSTSVVKTRTHNCPKFKEIVNDWMNRILKFKRLSTQRYYSERFKVLEVFSDKYMDEFTPNLIDEWLLLVKNKKNHSSRLSFLKELKMLRLIFNHYREYFDDNFKSPLKKRHMEAAHIKEASIKNKDLLENDFLKFRAALEKEEDGRFFATLATLQYYCSLRVSEAAGIYREDLIFGAKPEENIAVFRRSVKWIRRKGDKPFIDSNLKNSKKLGYKTTILLPQVKAYLEPFVTDTKEGPVFLYKGELLSFRQIEHRYNLAFKTAGLTFRGTHVLRHGSVRDAFSKHGDLGIAKQMLGNTSFKSTEVYAQPLQRSLDNFILKEWDKSLQIAAKSESESKPE